MYNVLYATNEKYTVYINYTVYMVLQIQIQNQFGPTIISSTMVNSLRHLCHISDV